MKLYTAPATPFGRTVEIVVHELGLKEAVEVVATPVKPTEPNKGFQAIAPLRRIPALRLDDGTVLVDSAVISEFLAVHARDTGLFAHDRPERFTVLSDYAMARGMCECAVSTRYEEAVRPQEKRWPAWSEDMMDKVDGGLAYFEASSLPEDGRLTIAKISLGALLGYLDFRFAHKDWRRAYPKLAAWFAVMNERPSFAATAPRG